MAILQHPAEEYCKVVDTDELCVAGGFQTARHEELRHIVMRLYKKGARGGSERMRLKIFLDDSCLHLYAWSSWVRLSDIEGIDADAAWKGDVRFDFESPNINKHRTYWVAIEIENYTRNRDTFFLAFLYDWPDPLYQQLGTPLYGLRMALYGVAV